MSIARDDSEFCCTCDGCGETEYGGTEDDFRAFVQAIKDGGWRIHKVDDVWEHYCPECVDGE